MRAEYARTIKYSSTTTQIRVASSTISQNSTVDPYGPPLLRANDNLTVGHNQRFAISGNPTATISELPPSPVLIRDRSLSPDDDSQNPRPNIHSTNTNNKSTNHRMELRQPVMKGGAHKGSAVTALPTKKQASSKKSDSDDDDFAAMVRKN